MLTTPRKQIAAAIGLAGLLCSVVLVLLGDTSDLRFVWGNEIVVVVLAGPSAWLAGLAVAGLFGDTTRWGWFGAFVGYVMATAVGAAIAGTVLVPACGTIVAPLILLANFLDYPLVGLGWLLTFVGLQHFSFYIRA